MSDYRGNNPRISRELSEWHAGIPALGALESDLPIVDPHHHLFGSAEDALHYRLDDLKRDLAGGHRVIGTVYVEAYESAWRKTGPQAMRPVGEVEMIVGLTSMPVQTPFGPCWVAAGAVANANLALGEAVAEVIEAEFVAAGGRLRGIRHHTASVDGRVGDLIKDRPRPHLMADAKFRRGLSLLDKYGLSFDSTVYHTQLFELADLADAFPNTKIVVNHVGVPIGVAEFRSKRTEVLAQWEAGMRALASRPNVYVKLGGMGMPVFGFGFEQGRTPATSLQVAPAWQPLIDMCIELFGTERCMFESNFPVDKQSCSYTELWNGFKRTTRALSREERNHLFWRTACRVYGLSDLERYIDQLVDARKLAGERGSPYMV